MSGPAASRRDLPRGSLAEAAERGLGGSPRGDSARGLSVSARGTGKFSGDVAAALSGWAEGSVPLPGEGVLGKSDFDVGGGAATFSARAGEVFSRLSASEALRAGSAEAAASV